MIKSVTQAVCCIFTVLPAAKVAFMMRLRSEENLYRYYIALLCLCLRADVRWRHLGGGESVQAAQYL